MAEQPGRTIDRFVHGALRSNGSRARSLQRAELELRALLAALPHDADAFVGVCRHVDDWGALLSEAQRHGVDGVLLAAGRDAGFAQEHQHPEWDEAVRRMRQSALWRDVLRAALRDALRALSEHGIPVVTLKGPVLAARLYDDEAVRPSTDLDLLVDPSSLDRAALALEPLGYVIEGGEVGRFFREHHHHIHAVHPTLPTLELHFDAYRGFGTSLPAAPLLARSTPCGVPGWMDARVLAPEDEFLYLAVHAASHRFERLVWLFDLKLLALRHPDLRWDLLASRAQSDELSAVVSFACALLRDWLGTPRLAAAHVPPLGDARRFAVEHLVGRRANRGVNAAADFAFCALLCEDVGRMAAFSRRFVRIKVLHEAPRRLRSLLSS